MESEEFKECRERLHRTAWNATTIYTIWKELQSRSEEEAAGLSRYRGFFLPLLHSLRQAFIAEFWKVFDPSPRANSLYSLLNAARTQRDTLAPRASDEQLREIGRLLRPHRKVIEKWRLLRIATVHDDLVRQKPDSLLIREADAVAEAALDALNRLSSAHDGQVWNKNFLPVPQG